MLPMSNPAHNILYVIFQSNMYEKIALSQKVHIFKPTVAAALTMVILLVLALPHLKW